MFSVLETITGKKNDLIFNRFLFSTFSGPGITSMDSIDNFLYVSY